MGTATTGIIHYRDEVPPAPWYVTAIDTFLSDWGPAVGKQNVLIFPCATAAESEIVAGNARARAEMRDVHRTAALPREYFTSLYLVTLMTPTDAPAWYTRGLMARRAAEREYAAGG